MVPGEKEEAGPVQNLRSLNPPPSSGPSNFKPLSKVSEEASSLDKDSSGGEASASGRSGKTVLTESHGRQSTLQVLGGIHEQVHTPACNSAPAAHQFIHALDTFQSKDLDCSSRLSMTDLQPALPCAFLYREYERPRVSRSFLTGSVHGVTAHGVTAHQRWTCTLHMTFY